jgi:hypothetical protein
MLTYYFRLRISDTKIKLAEFISGLSSFRLNYYCYLENIVPDLDFLYATLPLGAQSSAAQSLANSSGIGISNCSPSQVSGS